MKRIYLFSLFSIIFLLIIFFTKVLTFTSKFEVGSFRRRNLYYNYTLFTNKVKQYEICLLNTGKDFSISHTDNILDFVDTNQKKIFSFCQKLYVMVPNTKSVNLDAKYKNIYIIRYIYSDSTLLSLLLSHYFMPVSDEILFIRVKSFSEDVFDLDYNTILSPESKKVYNTDRINVQVFILHILRYLWMYIGYDFVKKNLDDITTSSMNEISEKYKDIPIVKCFDSHNNEDLSVLLRLYRRDNIKKQIEIIKQYNNVVEIIGIQNLLFRSHFPFVIEDELIKQSNNKITLIYVWCTNWNSVFFMSRLLPILSQAKYLMFLDDDQIWNPKYVPVLEEIIKSDNGKIVGIDGYAFRGRSQNTIKYKGEEYNYETTTVLYGTNFFQPQFEYYTWRYIIPYTLSGDDLILSYSSFDQCDIPTVLFKYKDNIFSFPNPEEYSTGRLNGSMYGMGNRIWGSQRVKCFRGKRNKIRRLYSMARRLRRRSVPNIATNNNSTKEQEVKKEEIKTELVKYSETPNNGRFSLGLRKIVSNAVWNRRVEKKKEEIKTEMAKNSEPAKYTKLDISKDDKCLAYASL